MFITNVSEKANKSLNKLENFSTKNTAGNVGSGFDAITVPSGLNWLYFNGRFVLPLGTLVKSYLGSSFLGLVG